MSDDDNFKLPRLYTAQALSLQNRIPLEKGQAHYLGNVLRRQNGDHVRLFNGKDGEWLGELVDLNKKGGDVVLKRQLMAQPIAQRRIHLFFAPIKKARMDWLIEKAVELGTTDFHPILTQNTEVRKINEERLHQQIFEAAEQCERFDIPDLHKLEKIEKALDQFGKEIPVLGCVERFDTKPITQIMPPKEKDVAFLIGPEGGFTAEEKTYLGKKTQAASLGETILRCETAVVKALVLLNS